MIFHKTLLSLGHLGAKKKKNLTLLAYSFKSERSEEPLRKSYVSSLHLYIMLVPDLLWLFDISLAFDLSLTNSSPACAQKIKTFLNLIKASLCTFTNRKNSPWRKNWRKKTDFMLLHPRWSHFNLCLCVHNYVENVVKHFCDILFSFFSNFLSSLFVLFSISTRLSLQSFNQFASVSWGMEWRNEWIIYR